MAVTRSTRGSAISGKTRFVVRSAEARRTPATTSMRRARTASLRAARQRLTSERRQTR